MASAAAAFVARGVDDRIAGRNAPERAVEAIAGTGRVDGGDAVHFDAHACAVRFYDDRAVGAHLQHDGARAVGQHRVNQRVGRVEAVIARTSSRPGSTQSARASVARITAAARASGHSFRRRFVS